MQEEKFHWNMTKFHFYTKLLSVMCVQKVKLEITLKTAFQWWNIVATTVCCGDDFPQETGGRIKDDGNINRALEPGNTSDRGGG